MNKISIIGLFTSLIYLSTVMPVSAQTIQCLRLESNIGAGSSGAAVSRLQEYLINSGLLNTKSSGYFGPATTAAVKVFQKNNNVSQTGYVGSLTRTALEQKSCHTTSTAAPATVPQTNPISTISTTPRISITSPATGTVLPIGSSTVIRWNIIPPSTYNIILEQPGGAGAGFIASNLSNADANRYVWKAGTIFSTQTNSEQTAPVGTYRIRIVNSISGANENDQTSGWFTLTNSQLTGVSVKPSSAPADNSTSVVLFGTNLTNSTAVYFDMNFSASRATNVFASSDGTVLVFIIPKNIPAGNHVLYINNDSSSNYVTVPFVVTSIQ